MRVAICDDERDALMSLKSMVEKNNLVSQNRCFLSLREFREAMEEGERFDLVLMDIEWKLPQNGIDFAADLFRISPSIQVIYVTGYNERFAQHIFLKPANVCGYLVKPVKGALLASLLEKAWQTVQELDEQNLLVQQKGVLHAVPLRKIYYLESRGHQVIIHTDADPIFCYNRLENMKERLPEYFLQCHKSYLVNLDNVRRIEKRHMVLKNEAEVPISKARYAQAREVYFRYIGELF